MQKIETTSLTLEWSGPLSDVISYSVNLATENDEAAELTQQLMEEGYIFLGMIAARENDGKARLVFALAPKEPSDD